MEKTLEDFKKNSISKNSNTEYLKLIENNPSAIFSNISMERIILWESSLYETINPTFIQNEGVIVNTIPDHENQKIIKNDAQRTRVRESVIIPAFKKLLEQLITYFCKTNNIKYKQGLNEIFGPLVLIQYKIKTFSLIKAYNIAECFVKKYMTNYFFEEGFFSLHSSLSLFTLLLKYHAPEVYNVLDNLMILPEMYATGWIMTMLSSKSTLDVTYLLWDHIIRINDPLFFHFIMVAFLKSKGQIILQTDKTLIPSLMSSLAIGSIDELDSIIQLAIQMRYNTPYSFRILANRLEIFKFGSTKLKEKYEYYKPETFPVLPIFPSEIFFITYKSTINCPDEDCIEMRKIKMETENKRDEEIKKEKNNKKDKKQKLVKDEQNEEDEDYYKDHKCEHCKMKLFKRIPFVLLDLRILEYGTFEDEDERTGFLPKMIMIPQNELKMDDFPEKITDRFIPDRGNYHFVFLTSKTDCFKDYENNFYSEKITDQEKRKMMFDIQTKVDKELDLQKAEEKISQKELFKLKEYDNLKLTLVSLLKQNFPYISYVYGGFNEIHSQCFKYDISLLNHEEEECILCKTTQKEEKKSKRNIFGKIKHLFKKIGDNKSKSKSNNQRKGSLDDSEVTHQRFNTLQNDSIKIKNALWIHKVKIKYDEILKIIANPKNFVTGCILKESSGGCPLSIDNKNLQLFLCLISGINEIHLYQAEKKQYDLGKPQITNKKNKAIVINPNDYQKELELTQVEKMSLFEVTNARKKPKMGNIVTIKYIKQPNEELENQNNSNVVYLTINKKKYIECTMVLDFTIERETKRFIDLIKHITEEEKLKNK